MFDKRYAVYIKARDVISALIVKPSVDLDDLVSFRIGVGEARWIFSLKVHKYLEELYEKGVDLYALEAERANATLTLADLQGADNIPLNIEPQETSKKRAELKKWFNRQYRELEGLMDQYLHIK